METITQTDLKRDCISGLAEAQQLFENKSPAEKACTGYSQLLHNFLFADFLMEGAIKYNNHRNLAFVHQLYRACLPQLESLSENYSEITQDLIFYLPRFENFASQFDSLQTIYKAYQKAFGGNEQ